MSRKSHSTDDIRWIIIGEKYMTTQHVQIGCTDRRNTIQLLQVYRVHQRDLLSAADAVGVTVNVVVVDYVCLWYMINKTPFGDIFPSKQHIQCIC